VSAETTDASVCATLSKGLKVSIAQLGTCILALFNPKAELTTSGELFAMLLPSGMQQ